MQAIKKIILCEVLKDILLAEYALKTRDTNKQNFLVELHNRDNIFGYIKFMSSPLKTKCKKLNGNSTAAGPKNQLRNFPEK